MSLKTLHNIPQEVESEVIDNLHIVTSERVLNSRDIWNGRRLKDMFRSYRTKWNYYPFIGLFEQIEGLSDHEYVVLCNFQPSGAYSQLCKIACELTKLGGDASEAWDNALNLEITGRYRIHLIQYQGFKRYIGEADKSKRVCRFCQESGEDIFKRDSHAISAFLGNDYVFCNEECDKCNSDLTGVLERDLDNYYKVSRALDRNLNRYSKKINVYGQNFHIDNTREIPIIEFYNKSGFDDFDGSSKEITLLGSDLVDIRNVYKCLVKFVIATLPNEELAPFKNTIEWIKGNLCSEQLPPLYRYEECAEYVKPELGILIRKDNRTDVPYCVARIGFLSNYYVFAVPYCQPLDVENSKLGDSLKNYFQLCKENTDIYTIEDFNSDDKVFIETHKILYKHSIILKDKNGII